MNRKNFIKVGFGLFVSGSALYFLYKRYYRKNIKVSKDSIRRQSNLQSELTKHLIHDVAGIIMNYSSVCEQCDNLANDFHDNDIERCVQNEIVACKRCGVYIYKCNNTFIQRCRKCNDERMLPIYYELASRSEQVYLKDWHSRPYGILSLNMDERMCTLHWEHKPDQVMTLNQF